MRVPSVWLRLVALFLAWIGIRSAWTVILTTDDPNPRLAAELGWGSAIEIATLLVAVLSCWHTEVRVRKARYTVAELRAFVSRIDSVLAEPELRVRGGAWFTAESLIVTAHSRAALERARIRLAREVRIPQAMLFFE
jgi:hypothetical protein